MITKKAKIRDIQKQFIAFILSVNSAITVGEAGRLWAISRGF